MGLEAAASDPAVGTAHHRGFPRPWCPPAQAGRQGKGFPGMPALLPCYPQHISPGGTQPRLEYLLLLLTVSPEPIPGKWDLSEGTNQPAHVYWGCDSPGLSKQPRKQARFTFKTKTRSRKAQFLLPEHGRCVVIGICPPGAPARRRRLKPGSRYEAR